MNIKLEHIVIGILLLAAFGYITLPGMQPARVTPTTTTIPGEIITTCDSTVTPDIDINAYDVDNPTTAVTDANNLYRKVPGGTWTSWTLGTEITDLSFGETYEFFIPGDTTTSNVVAKAFGKYIKWKVPCKEDEEMKIYVANDETYDGLTATWFNADGDKDEQSFSAGDVYTVQLRWKAGTDQYYGHPYLTSYPMLTDKTDGHSRKYPNILCLKLNSTAWEEPQEVYLNDGTEMDRVSAPTISNADGATTHNMYCYEAPVIGDRNVDIYATLEADSTSGNAPTHNETAYLYAGNLYINSDTGEPEWGVEDDSAAYTAGNADADELTLQFVN